MTRSEQLVAECRALAERSVTVTTDLATVRPLCIKLLEVCREYRLAVDSALAADERIHEMIKERE